MGFGSASKEWENIRQRKVQLINFLSSLECPSENSVIANRMAGGKLNNYSMEPREQQEDTPIIVISDDEDGNNSGYKELTTSDLASDIMKWVASNGVSQAFETIHVEGEKKYADCSIWLLWTHLWAAHMREGGRKMCEKCYGPI